MAMSQDLSVSNTEPDTTLEASDFLDGFKRVEAELQAIPEEDLVIINLEILSAVATVLGTLPELRALRERFANLPDFDLVRFDKLRDYALALGHAHMMYRAAVGPSDGLAELAADVAELRDILAADAMALAKRKIIDEAQVLKLRGGSGYKNVASEVGSLVGLLTQHWDQVQGRSALQKQELEHAGRRAQELLTAVGVKEQSPALASAAADVRQRAFTLFVNAYDDARRAVSYLRWHKGDEHEIAPSLYSGHGGRGSSETEPVVPAPVVPPGPAPAPAVAAAPVAGAAAGFPGASPFVHP
jgi:hypothetical protein